MLTLLVMYYGQFLPQKNL